MDIAEFYLQYNSGAVKGSCKKDLRCQFS